MHHLPTASGNEPRSRSPFAGVGGTLEKRDRMLVPVKQVGDVEAVLAYLLTLDRGTDVSLAILHVTAPTEAISSADHPGYAEILLEQVESRCRAGCVEHESYILAGDLVFSILDAAELLACDAIVMPVLKTRSWHFFFLTRTVRKMQRLRRDVPLVLINANGVVIRSIRV